MTVTVLSLAIGSFTQQVVKSVVCNVQKPIANVSLPIGYGDPYAMWMRPGAGRWDLDTSVKARVYNALSGASYDRSVLINGCSTGNCTFPESAPGRTYSTPAFCSKCVDTTSFVREKISSFDQGSRMNELYLPNGLEVGPFGSSYTGYLLTFDTSANTSWISLSPEKEAGRSRIWNVSALTIHTLALTVAGCAGPYGEGVIRQDWNCSYPSLGFSQEEIENSASWNAVSATCSIYPCIQDIKAEIRTGRMIETVVDEVVISNYSQSDTGMYRWPCYIDGIRYDEHNITQKSWGNDSDIWTNHTTNGLPYQCLYRVPSTIFYSLSWWLVNAFDGNCTMANNMGSGQYARRWPLCKKWWLSNLYNKGNTTFDTIATTMSNVATAITDSYRLGSISTLGTIDRNTVDGTVWETTVCTQSSWQWLLFPASMVALTVLSLMLMVASTASGADQPPVWKSSILPFLCLQDATRSERLRSYRMGDMKEVANAERAQLVRDEQLRWRLKQTGVPAHELY